MKLLAINGSPRPKGNTTLALRAMEEVAKAEGVAWEEVRVGHLDVRGCIACGKCSELGRCIFTNDIVNELAQKLEQADGLILASPVYYASPNGSLISVLDRLFYSYPHDLSHKVGAALVCARRGGASAAFDVLNKYFTISGMPVASSYYWNQLYGCFPGEAALDLERLDTMCALANNMIFLMRSIELGKQAGIMPARPSMHMTNFISQNDLDAQDIHSA